MTDWTTLKKLAADENPRNRAKEYAQFTLSTNRNLDFEAVHGLNNAVNLASEFLALLAENQRYREALEFYASGEAAIDYEKDFGTPGASARTALKGDET